MPPISVIGSRPYRTDWGFTLIEVLLVITLMAVFSAILAPNFITTTRTELRSATGLIATALRQARLQAIKTKTPAGLVLDVNDNTMRIDGIAKIRTLPESIALEVTAAREVRRGKQIGTILFFPDGSTTGGRVRLTLGELATVVDIAWLTGLIQIREPAPDG